MVLRIKWVWGAFHQLRSWKTLLPKPQKEFFNVSDDFIFFLRLLGKQSNCTKEQIHKDETFLIHVLYNQVFLIKKPTSTFFSFCLCYAKT